MFLCLWYLSQLKCEMCAHFFQGTGLFAIKRAADDIIKEKDAIIDK